MNPPGKIIVTTATIDSHVSPTVLIGRTDKAGTVVARYRWGRLTVTHDHRNPAPYGGSAGQWLMVKQVDPEGLDGCMSYDELREQTSELIDWPDELTPRTSDDSEATTYPEDYEG